MERCGLVVAILVIGTLVLSLLGSAQAQCDQKDRGGPLLCCKGRNSSCAVDELSEKRNSHRRTVCYCDEFCESAGDCCQDFEEARRKCSLQGWLVFKVFISWLA